MVAAAKYPQLAGIGNELRTAYLRARRVAEFNRMVDEQLIEARQRLPADSPELAGLFASIGSDLLEFGDYSRAESVLAECVQIRRQIEPDVWTTFNAQSMLGGAMVGKRSH